MNFGAGKNFPEAGFGLYFCPTDNIINICLLYEKRNIW